MGEEEEGLDELPVGEFGRDEGPGGRPPLPRREGFWGNRHETEERRRESRSKPKKKKIKQAEQDSPIDLVENEKEKEKEKAMRMMEIQQLGWCLLEE